MSKYNLSKEAKKSGFKNYNKMIEDNVLVPAGDIAEKNINISLETKDKDNTVPYEVQLEASRDGKDNLIIAEKALNENEKVYNEKRLDQTGDVMPINLETIKHEQKKEEVYRKAATDGDTAFWDKYLNVSVGETKVDVNVPISQLHNVSDRFNKIDDATDAKYDKMVYASLKDADAMLFHIYATASGRDLTVEEKQQVVDINSGKARLLMEK
jgi:predicted nucleic acid-binding protein